MPLRMADDREVLREIWHGRLPVSFSLAEEEAVTLNVPDPFYLMVPRLLYLPLVTDKVRKHFVRHVSPENSGKEMWFEYNGKPIKWNYPIGLWYDLNVHDPSLLPWPITVHFDNYPESVILRCPSKEAVRSQFMSNLKEADALKHKSQVINGMQEKDHHQLWTGFQNDRFDQFWGVNRKLMESVAGEGFRNVPMRLYFVKDGSEGQGSNSIVMTQKLLRPVDEDTATWVSLHEALVLFLGNNIADLSKYRVLVHGVEPPLSTPVQWLSEHLSYPDNFLHVAVIAKSYGAEASTSSS